MDRGEYNNPLEFEYDMMLVWNNCMTYNQVRDCAFRWSSQLGGNLQQNCDNSLVLVAGWL